MKLRLFFLDIANVWLKFYCFIPLLWLPLQKQGNSNQDERIDWAARGPLLARFAQLWPGTDHRLIVLADREFIGRRWIK
jgi:hypothetical protein